MYIKKKIWVKVTQVCDLEIDEQLAKDCEKYLKDIAVNPEEVPHISVQTIAQIFNYSTPDSLDEKKITIKGYSKNYEVSLTGQIEDYVNDELFSLEPYEVDSDTLDSENELYATATEEEEILYADNPDFPKE